MPQSYWNIPKTLSKFSWQFEIVDNNALGRVPVALQNLEWLLKTEDMPEVVDDAGLAYPSFTLEPGRLPGVHIQAVVVKSSYQYRLKRSSLMLEVATYRSWEGCSTSIKPTVKCGIMMYKDSWLVDQGAKQRFGNAEEWDPEPSSSFPDRIGDRQGFQDLLSKIHLVQQFLDRAT